MLAANGAFMDAYNTDVRPLLAGLREDMGLDPDPIAAYHALRLRRQDHRRPGGRHPGQLGQLAAAAGRAEIPRHATKTAPGQSPEKES